VTGASSRISTPASRAARGVRQGDTRRANLELAGLAVVLAAFLFAVGRVAAGHYLGAPGEVADADVVRTWLGFTIALGRSAAIVAAGFFAAHGIRRFRGAIGDPWLLPIVFALCGLGLLTMASVNDPWRERLLFEPFAMGVALGCVALTVASLADFSRLELHRFAFVFLIAALGLSVLLLVFGSGPGRSAVKVNLFGVQPVEVIRPLIALFLAGYFARRWEWLRELADPLARQHALLKRLKLPRLADVIPVAIGMALVLLFFFFQRDLGPALVLACTFLVTYSVARDRWGLAAVGLATLVGAFTAAYTFGYPTTVVKRIDMWKSPWDNGVSGGDQVAHALWGLASGGLFGGGLSETSPRYIPTAENDLVLASLGEILGFAGVLVALALFATLVVRALRIARRTDQPYVALLVVGLVASLAAQTLLIVGGLLGLLPLSGVVTPFLSLGRSSMVSNLAVVGLLLAASRQAPPAEEKPFFRPASRVGLVVAGLLAVAAGRAFLVQVWNRGDIMTRQTRTRQADGAVRPQDNPRLREVARFLQRGAVRDRRGLPIAMDSTLDVTAHAKEYAALGVNPCGTADGGGAAAARRRPEAGARQGPAPRGPASPGAAPPVAAERCYPLGGSAFHLLGDSVSKANWAATNSSFVERDFDARLRGYQDYAELLALWDHRDDPFHLGVRAIRERPRDVTLTIDARLQARTAALLGKRLGDMGLSKGAVVVLDVATGEVLASVSAPWPRLDRGRVGMDEDARRPELPLLDRARYGQYPPGSTFKLVTAAAALRASSDVAERHFDCRPLSDGRVGIQLPGWRRPVRDDVTDREPHGDVNLDEGLRVSCNAYFAQLGLAVGSRTLKSTADAFELATSTDDSADDLKAQLPWASYGQAEVLASPFRMARVAATMAAHGEMRPGRWVLEPAPVTAPARRILEPAAADRIARAMRRVVTGGTASSLAGNDSEVSGKTGTAEVAGAASHSWFVGFAPSAGPKQIAVAVIVENGGYGARAAVPLAGDVVSAARSLGIIP
jgi:cell division protein FtsW (lipid II flippase)/cell division protein FtsI/penicillin-binding protein 2